MAEIDKYINQIICGDCRDILKEFPDNSIDSCVTDPPYGLSEHDEAVIREVLGKWLNGQDDYVPHKRGFMGNEWDAFVPPPAIWREVYRVLKPGAHILVFAGARTQDLMSMSLRLAGFEVREVLMWLYSSGFPKSLDISKAIDKQLGEKREKTGIDNRRGNGNSGIYKLNVNNPPKMQFDRYDIPATPEAEQWEGWGTAMKPAYEPIILARKPIFEKNIALNVLKWGVGGINIDESRVGKREKIQLSGGRFPSNVLLECICDEVIEGKEIGKESGYNFDKSNNNNPVHITNNIKSGVYYKDKQIIHTNPECPCYMLDEQSNMSVSRFFYVAKASKSERNIGLNGMNKKEVKRQGLCGEHNNPEYENHHPTIKPIKLMEYLVRLITPAGGIVLDPFAGSGSTCIACKKLGYKYIGIEISEEYCNIARHRISAIPDTIFTIIPPQDE